MSGVERGAGPGQARLGLFIDGPFRARGEDGREVHTNDEELGFGRFAAAVGERFAAFFLIARGVTDGSATPYPLPDGVRLLALPDYGHLRRLPWLALAIPRTIAAMWRALDRVDVVWISGAHPFGLLLAGLARMRRRRRVLLIRQDSPAYFRSRLPGPAWTPLLVPLYLLDFCFRRLARRTPATVVGEEIARRYGGVRRDLMQMRVTLMERAQLVDAPSPLDWSGEIRLLTVGRLAAEKNPQLAAEILAELDRRDPGRFRLTWVGTGPQADALRSRAESLGVADRLELPGYVPFGDPLLGLYRESHAFLHLSLTEGVPGVLYEAMAAGLPIVATDVGGVAEALRGGEAGLLIPPDDAIAAVEAIRTLLADAELRQRLASRALALASEMTIESESARVAAFIAGERA